MGRGLQHSEKFLPQRGLAMQSLAIRQWQTKSPEETRALGRRLGQHAAPGDVIACCGALGAGKTAFIQGFAEGLGIGEDAYVRSPTFTLVHEYKARIPLYHFDFYRLSYALEAQDIGFEEFLTARGVVIIEWADKFPELLPAGRLDTHIYILSTEERSIQCLAYDSAYVRYLCLTS
jgi:tRNA threonylcarbamoyladenosine biosynthesis protein TsaE